MDARAFLDLVHSVETEVRLRLAANDASHDFAHIERVRHMAVRLLEDSKRNGTHVDVGTSQVVELGALLHDVADWKYSGSDESNNAAASEILSKFEASSDLSARVLALIDGISFSGELANASSADLPFETSIVQDADRLEAIGAIGIARCFTYGGAKHRPLHDPSIAPLPATGLSKEAYRDPQRVHTSINHFHEKLLTLRDRMKTPAGRAVAESRHAFMQQFLDQFLAEWRSER